MKSFWYWVPPRKLSKSVIMMGETKKLEAEIRFLPESGNEFQGESTKFDFSLGFIGRRPPPSPPPWWPFPWPFPF